MVDAEALAALLGFATYLLGEAQTASLFLGACVSFCLFRSIASLGRGNGLDNVVCCKFGP